MGVEDAGANVLVYSYPELSLGNMPKTSDLVVILVSFWSPETLADLF